MLWYIEKITEIIMYPIFESGQKVFTTIINDWDSINDEVWVCLMSNVLYSFDSTGIDKL